jgi:hypothetical protein
MILARLNISNGFSLRSVQGTLKAVRIESSTRAVPLSAVPSTPAVFSISISLEGNDLAW